MYSRIFHNSKLNKKNLKKEEAFYLQSVNIKKNVDINRLLNRVKSNQKIEKKNTITFFSLGILLVSLMGVFISI